MDKFKRHYFNFIGNQISVKCFLAGEAKQYFVCLRVLSLRCRARAAYVSREISSALVSNILPLNDKSRAIGLIYVGFIP